MFTNFKIQQADLDAYTQNLRTGFSTSGKPGSFEDNAVRVIAERMRRHPELHVEFGPYWWALKQVLADAGHAIGSAGNPMVAAEYRGANRGETLVMAELFKDFYRANYIAGTSAFDLDGDGGLQDMADEDMRARVPA